MRTSSGLLVAPRAQDTFWRAMIQVCPASRPDQCVCHQRSVHARGMGKRTSARPSPAPAANGLSKYEEERLATIAANEAFLASLNLAPLVQKSDINKKAKAERKALRNGKKPLKLPPKRKPSHRVKVVTVSQKRQAEEEAKRRAEEEAAAEARRKAIAAKRAEVRRSSMQSA